MKDSLEVRKQDPLISNALIIKSGKSDLKTAFLNVNER